MKRRIIKGACGLVVGVVASVLCGCGSSSKPEVEHHDLESAVLVGEDDATLGSCAYILMLDSVILVNATYSDSLFHLIDRNTLEYLGRFGSIGQGPGDFIDVVCISRVDGNTIGLTELNRGYRFVEAEISPKRKPIVTYNVRYSFDGSGAGEFRPAIGDNYIAGRVASENSSYNPFMLINRRNGNVVGYYGEYPCRDEEKSWSPAALAEAYQPNMAVSPDGTKMVSTITGAEIASFYSITPDSVRLVSEFRDVYPTMAYIDGVFRGIYATEPERFIGSGASDKYAYVLHSELSYVEAPFSALTGNRVLVYNWDGEQVQELRLDRRIGPFTIDQDEGRLYGVTTDGSDPEIIYFDLPE